MRIDELVIKLRNVDDILRERVEGVRFRGEEQGRFRFKYNLDDYCGTFETRETPVAVQLSNAIFYAIHRSDGRRYDEERGQPIVGYNYGFPLVIAIDVSKYPIKPGGESGEEVISGKINREDIVILFGDNKDFLKEMIGDSPYYKSLIRAKTKVLKESKR